jgi:hypothetical protein
MMRSTATVVLASALIAAGLTLTACEQSESAGDRSHAAGDDHTHAPGEEHDHAAGDEHDHAGDTGHGHEEGEPHDLGAATIGGFEVQVTRHGDIAAGAETAINISVAGEAQPAAIRVWIGTEDARGSLKARAEAEGDHYHAHIEAPDPLPEGAAVWVEVESAEGARQAVSFPVGG